MYYYPEQSIATALKMTPEEINRMVALRVKRCSGDGQGNIKFATQAEYEEWKSKRTKQ